MDVGLNGATLGNPELDKFLQVAQTTGFTGVEPRIDMLITATPVNIKNYNLHWFPLNAIEGLFTLPTPDILERAANIFELARQFEISQVIVVPGRGSPPKFDDAVKLLRELKTTAAEFGISILYEILGFSDAAFNTLEEARKLCEFAEVQLVLDTFHLAISRTALSTIQRLPKEHIGLVHVSDAMTARKALHDLTDYERVLPGEGGLPLQEILCAIKATGYDDRFSIEVFHPKYAYMPHDLVAREALLKMKNLLRACGWEIKNN